MWCYSILYRDPQALRVIHGKLVVAAVFSVNEFCIVPTLITYLSKVQAVSLHCTVRFSGSENEFEQYWVSTTGQSKRKFNTIYSWLSHYHYTRRRDLEYLKCVAVDRSIWSHVSL